MNWSISIPLERIVGITCLQEKNSISYFPHVQFSYLPHLKSHELLVLTNVHDIFLNYILTLMCLLFDKISHWGSEHTYVKWRCRPTTSWQHFDFIVQLGEDISFGFFMSWNILLSIFHMRSYLADLFTIGWCTHTGDLWSIWKEKRKTLQRWTVP